MADPFDDDPWIGGAPPTASAPMAARRSRPPLLASAATAVAAAAAVTSVYADPNLAAYVVALSCYALVLSSAYYRTSSGSGLSAQRELPGVYRWMLRPVSFIAVVVAAWGAAEAFAL